MAKCADQELLHINDFSSVNGQDVLTLERGLSNLEDEDQNIFSISRTNMADNGPRLVLTDDLIGETSDNEDTPLICRTDSTDALVSLSPDERNDHCHTGQSPGTNRKARNQLMFACGIVLVFMIVEIIGGYFANSLAIMTDAAHLLSDFASFLISLFALWVATRPATRNMSFGYYRAEILGAVVSVLIVWILTGVLVYMAILRCIDQSYEINADVMLITAACGVAINILLGCVLHQTGHGHSHGLGGHGHGGHGHSHQSHDHQNGGQNVNQQSSSHAVHVDPFTDIHSVNTTDSDRHLSETSRSQEQPAQQQNKKNINVRAAFIHVLGDLIQSIGVLIAAYIIKFKPEYKIADPICTFLFSILVLFTTLNILKDAMHVLMEGAPKDINYDSVKKDLLLIQGVKMAHSLHIWSLTTNRPALAVHLAVDPSVDSQKVLRIATRKVQQKYQIFHCTIQVEHYQPYIMAECQTCQGPTK
ncbi:proton-coupled zinc antiporter SLC30A2-like [Glandiceps talaboti]